MPEELLQATKTVYKEIVLNGKGTTPITCRLVQTSAPGTVVKDGLTPDWSDMIPTALYNGSGPLV